VDERAQFFVIKDSDPELPPIAERRPAKRGRVLLSGVLVHADDSHSFRCAIRDLGPNGARITIPKGQMIPRNVYLIDIRAQKARQAELVWVDAHFAGLKYLQSIDLTKPLDPALIFLKRILDAHATR
jgi:hypothetical protein